MACALILDGHSRAAVEATQSLGRRGVEIFVSSSERNPLAFSSRYARHKLKQPSPAPAEAVLEWLEQLDGRHQFRLIVPSTESALQAFLSLPDDHTLRSRAVLPSRDALACALDRGATCRLAVEMGVPIPATRLIEPSLPIPDAKSFPLVLKPVRSKSLDRGQLRTFSPIVVTDAAAYSSVLADWLPRMAVLEQEYVEGWGVGIELLYRAGKLVWYFAHERLHEWPLTGGASTYRRAIEPPPEMFIAARRLLDRLKWNGVAMVEFKRRPNGTFALMEINPRLWGSLALSIDAGTDFPLALWKIAGGESPLDQPSYRRGLRTRNLRADLTWQKANWLADHRNSRLLTRPRMMSLAELALVLTGRERWDHFVWTDLGPIFEEFKRTLRTAGHARERRKRLRYFARERNQIVRRVTACVAEARSSSRVPSMVFVCQANICRSPFASIAAAACLPGFRINSAGFDERADRPTPPNVADEAARLGFDMSACRSMPVTDDVLRSADVIFFMDLNQYARLAASFPDQLERAAPLGLFADPPVVEISDPNHKDAATTRRVLLQIESAVKRLADVVSMRTRSEGTVRSAAV